MINLKDLTIEELQTFFSQLGEKPFRAKQVYQWIYRGAQSFDEMTDLSKALREKLKELAVLTSLHIVRVQTSQKDGTKKYLFALEDGNTIESVFMQYDYGNSICISSQAGCKMGCRFCASAAGGLCRNLTPGEMIEQLLTIERDTGERVNHIVVMGTGEPFDNYENLKQAIKSIHKGHNTSLRNITVSTCGLIPGIETFAKDFPQVNLAVSLHSVDDAVRNNMMPVNRKYAVEELLQTCRAYTDQTGRRITFEYALIREVNDTKEQIDLLARRLKGMLCHVNLIPLNKVAESGLKGSNRKQALDIAQYLTDKGIPTTVRRELGADIDAACGQLRLDNNESS